MDDETYRQDLYDRLVKISGPLQDHTGIAKDSLYGTFHYKKFYYTEAWRDTIWRFNRFEIPDDLSGRTVLDIGSNTGAMSLEFARRGAKVTGMEYNQERVDICNELAKYLEADAEFHQGDIDNGLPSHLDRKYDIVICTAVDAYVKDRFALYDLMACVAKEAIYFESNFQIHRKQRREEIKDILQYFRGKFHTKHGYKGTCARDSRRCFAFFAKRMTPDRLINGWHVRRFQYEEAWKEVKAIYEKIKDIPQCVEMDFSEHMIVKSKHIKGNVISRINLKEGDRKSLLRKQMILFLLELAKRKVAHRDIHAGNVIVTKENKLFVIDWEWVIENNQMYDVTGKGELPYNGIKQTISFGVDRKQSIGHLLNIKASDLIKLL